MREEFLSGLALLTKLKRFFIRRMPLSFLGGFIVILFLLYLYHGAAVMQSWWRKPLSVSGIIWQPNNATTNIDGNWQKLGVDQLLIQWSIVDGINYLSPDTPQRPDWWRIGQQPWAKKIILGLDGEFDERKARTNVLILAQKSAQIIEQKLPLNIIGYYFPVEVDPTWAEAASIMPQALAQLPRPLWISVYDSANVGAKILADWLASWLPPDVGVFFQDGVGVEARTPLVARQYMDELAKTLGHDRVKVIVEAFRPGNAHQFRPATKQELLPQITIMQGYDIFLFDGPNYLSNQLVTDLASGMQKRLQAE
ncbi:hypothetical protein [Acetobacter orientalis]|uniref:hypothetical protein n=2 Tax=Acetobacter orientalis TaxID=146474 RepID=UPI0039E824FB